MSDTSDTEQAQAEPVDAEFEPAPGSDKKPRKTKAPKAKASGNGLPWLTIAVVTVAASSLGGGTGWLIGRYAPNPDTSGLEDRLAALETAGEAAGVTETLSALQARLSAVEGQIQGAQLRAEAFEQLIRDVAALRDRVGTLEAAPASNPDDALGTGADPEALAQFQARLDDAVSALNTRLDALSADTQTARAVADQAQASVQQALSLITQAGASDRQTSESSADGAASSTALAVVEARVSSLETALADLNAQRAALDALQDAVNALAGEAPGEALASAASLQILADRIAALETGVAAITDAATPRNTGPVAASLTERALAFAAVSRAAASSDPFPVAVADLSAALARSPGGLSADRASAHRCAHAGSAGGQLPRQCDSRRHRRKRDVAGCNPGAARRHNRSHAGH